MNFQPECFRDCHELPDFSRNIHGYFLITPDSFPETGCFFVLYALRRLAAADKSQLGHYPCAFLRRGVHGSFGHWEKCRETLYHFIARLISYSLMSAIYLLVGASICVAAGFLGAFVWSIRNGQYDDEYTPSVRILFEDGVQKSTPELPEAAEN